MPGCQHHPGRTLRVLLQIDGFPFCEFILAAVPRSLLARTGMGDASAERQRKRPRPSREPTSVHSPESSSSDGLSGELHSVLLAETAAGRSVQAAVRALFDLVSADELPTSRIHDINLAAPVLAALAASPELADDLHTVARMCDAVLTLAHDEIEMPLSRKRLDLGLSSLKDVADIIAGARNIVVLTGAGVSVSCGIPDFRSKGGLYDAVLERFGLHDPQAIFDLEEFKMDPRLFYSFAKDVMPTNDLRPSPTHRFIAELSAHGKLLRNYSQNIDGLERRAGVPEERVVLCHGSFLTATCMRKSCRAKISGSEIAAEVAAGTVPICRKCNTPGGLTRSGIKQDSDDDMEMDASTMGVLKPDIVFFGENLPRSVSDNLEKDVSKADLLLVLGTSLQVAPVARIPQYFRDEVPRILVNRELVSYDFDVELLGDCDVVIERLRSVLKWGHEGEERDEDRIARKTEIVTEATLGCIRVTGGKETVAKDPRRELTANATKNSNPTGRFRPPRRFLFPGAAQYLRDGERNTHVPKESISVRTVAGVGVAGDDREGGAMGTRAHVSTAPEQLAINASDGVLPNEIANLCDGAVGNDRLGNEGERTREDAGLPPNGKLYKSSVHTDRANCSRKKDKSHSAQEQKNGCVVAGDRSAS